MNTLTTKQIDELIKRVSIDMDNLEYEKKDISLDLGYGNIELLIGDLPKLLSALEMAKGYFWQPINDFHVTVNSEGITERIIVYVPKYGISTAHWCIHTDRWICHAVLNKEAQPTMFLNVTPPKESE